jgi:hypothetical protein
LLWYYELINPIPIINVITNQERTTAITILKRIFQIPLILVNFLINNTETTKRITAKIAGNNISAIFNLTLIIL